jgi:hypothetical protein
VETPKAGDIERKELKRILLTLTGLLLAPLGISHAVDTPQPWKPAAGAPAEAPKLSRPKLQIINGSSQTIDTFWLRSETERVSNGSVAPGKETLINTTLGHRFEVVGREDKVTATVTSEVPVQGFRFDPTARDGVPAFYRQSVSANGFPIVASGKVNPYALKEAAFLVNQMLAKRPEVREAMIKSGARLCIMAHNEYTTDLPEFAHNIHLRGMVNVDPTFDGRLKAAYDAAMKAGLWKGKYASVNHHEYFAVGAAAWYGHNRFNDFDHNHVHLRWQLIEYDPGLAAICREVFGDAALKYTKPATRLTGHMAGYDPAKAPSFVWPERLKRAKAEIRAKAEARDKAANGETRR